MANNFRLNARKPKNNAGLATPKGEIYLLYREDIIAMPDKDKRGVLTTGDIIIKEGRRFHLLYTTPATQVHNRDTEGDVDSRGWKKKISGNYPGDELEINEFVKNNVNQGFIAVVKSCQSEFMKIYGSVNNPLYFTGSFVDDSERKGYELTFEQTFADEDPVLFYSGKILVDEDALSESDPEFSSIFIKLDGSNITEENKEILKEKLDIGNLPPNIATIDKDDEVGNVYSKIESDANYLPKTTTTISEPNAEFKYAYLTNEANETRRMLVGDLGKNVANSKPTSVAGAGLNMGAIWDIETNGFPLRINRLPDKSADSTFSRMRVQNPDGQEAWSNGSNILKAMPNLLSEAEKTAWKTAMNGGWTTNTMSVILINPTVIKYKDENQFIVLIGSNLNLPPTNFKIEILSADSTASNFTVLYTIDNSQVNLISNTSIAFWFNPIKYGLSIGDYKIRLWNGVAYYITGLTFKVIDSANIQPLLFTHSPDGLVLKSGTSGLQVVNSSKDITLSADANIKALELTNSKDIVAQFKTDLILKGNENWCFDIINSNEVPMGAFQQSGKSCYFGISSSSSFSSIHNTLDYELYVGWSYMGGANRTSLYIGSAYIGNAANNTVRVIKYSNVLLLLLINSDETQLLAKQFTINTDLDYAVVFGKNNQQAENLTSSFYITGEYKF